MTQPADTPQHLTLAGLPRQRPARRRRAVAVTPAMLDGAPDFAPVPREHSRYDGWTAERQRMFVKPLAEHGCVRRAASALGMSEVGAYQLRRAPGGEAFAQPGPRRRRWCDVRKWWIGDRPVLAAHHKKLSIAPSRNRSNMHAG